MRYLLAIAIAIVFLMALKLSELIFWRVKMKLKEVIEHLEAYVDKEQECAYSIWFLDDVEQQLMDRKIFRHGEEQPKLSVEEMKAVLQYMHNKHDCNIGLNWEFMDACIDWVLDERS